LPRRPLVMLVLSLVTALGIVADLGWRTHTRSAQAAEVNEQALESLRSLLLTTGAIQPSSLSVPSPQLQTYIHLADRATTRPLAARERQTGATAQLIKSAATQALPNPIDAIAIAVNGVDIVAVVDEASAKQVRDQILETYRATVLHDVSAIEQLTFQESISWHAKAVQPDRIRTVEEAINILRLGTDKLATYTVAEGDTGWDIARNYDLTTEQLAKANPGANLDSLQIGQVLNISYKEPHIHTLSVAKRVVQERIPFQEEIVKDPDLWPWQYEVVTPGEAGTRELTIREYREDGKIVKSEVLENKQVAKPKTQIAKVGTKQIPTMGTGSLVFPVVGTITSYFGPRWGSHHNAIDIGAPSGTPILAADSGMVVFRGWSGNYGNMIKIDHGGGELVTLYAHLSSYNVKLGDTVSKGDVIGYVGNTGFSTGPHLHYEILVDGSPVNPLSYYP